MNSGPRTGLMIKEDRNQLRQNIAQFSTVTKNIILGIKDGRRQRDIAGELDITIDVLNYRLQKARRFLKGIFSRNSNE